MNQKINALRTLSSSLTIPVIPEIGGGQTVFVVVEVEIWSHLINVSQQKTKKQKTKTLWPPRRNNIMTKLEKPSYKEKTFKNEKKRDMLLTKKLM